MKTNEEINDTYSWLFILESGGLAAVTLNGKHGCIDTKGTPILGKTD